MKTEKNIYEKIVEIDNIKKAIWNASKGKRQRKKVKIIINNMDYYSEQLQKMLLKKEYVPNEYEKMKIHDGVRKKVRVIYKPKFYPDQCIHWCLMQQIEKLISRGMYDYCCGSVKNRGISHGMKYLKKVLVRDRKNTKYCLKLDIKKFYPNINKEILKKKFRRIIADRNTLDLIDLIVDSVEKGVPIGNYTSQWFANFYLQNLDHYIKEQLKIPYYVRYMDDMVLFHRNKKKLHQIRKDIEQYLQKEDLKLKENWQLFKVDSRPLDFLGYRFYRGYTTLRRSNFLRIKRRIKKISKKRSINYTDASAVFSYNGWLKHCDSFNFRQKYIKPYINMNKCKGVIKNESRKRFKAK